MPMYHGELSADELRMVHERRAQKAVVCEPILRRTVGGINSVMAAQRQLAVLVLLDLKDELLKRGLVDIEGELLKRIDAKIDILMPDGETKET